MINHWPYAYIVTISIIANLIMHITTLHWSHIIRHHHDIIQTSVWHHHDINMISSWHHSDINMISSWHHSDIGMTSEWPHCLGRLARAGIRSQYTSIPLRKTFSFSNSLWSCSSMGVLFMGEKPNAGIPS